MKDHANALWPCCGVHGWKCSLTMNPASNPPPRPGRTNPAGRSGGTARASLRSRWWSSWSSVLVPGPVVDAHRPLDCRRGQMGSGCGTSGRARRPTRDPRTAPGASLAPPAAGVSRWSPSSPAAPGGGRGRPAGRGRTAAPRRPDAGPRVVAAAFVVSRPGVVRAGPGRPVDRDPMPSEDQQVEVELPWAPASRRRRPARRSRVLEVGQARARPSPGPGRPAHPRPRPRCESPAGR